MARRQPKWAQNYQRQLNNAKRRARTLERNYGLITDFNQLSRPANAREARRQITQLQRISTKAFQSNKLPSIVQAVSTFETPWGDRAQFRFSAKELRRLQSLERQANRVRSIIGLDEIDYGSSRSFTTPEGLRRYMVALQRQGNLRSAIGKRGQYVSNYIKGLEAARGGDVDVFIDRVITRINDIGVGQAASMLMEAERIGVNINVFVFASDQTLIGLNIATIASFWGVNLRE